METKVVKVINESERYTDKKGKEHVQTNYYLVVNNNYIAIRPSFKDGYNKLDLIAEVVRNGK